MSDEERYTLTVRSPHLKEALLDNVKPVAPNPRAEAASRVVLLVHGFANSTDEAKNGFGRFVNNLRPLSPTRSLERFGTLWELHWPGDHPLGWWKPLDKAYTLATYAARIRVAKEAGSRLAAYLEARDRRQTVHIVAHSLGCRVTLHAIRGIRERGEAYPGARIGHVFLLAPAVPVPDCLPNDLSRLYHSRWRRSSEHVFFSARDAALRASRTMQWLAGDHGQAVGVAGAPLDRWTSTEDTKLGHTRYWRSATIAEPVSEWLLYGSRSQANARRSIPEQKLPRRERLVRAITSRLLPARPVRVA